MRQLVPIMLLVGFTAALLVAAPGTLRMAFLVLAPVTAAIVFRQSRTLYIELCLWLWFLTPLLRRLVDWRTAYSDQTVMLSAPYLATMVSGVVLLRHVRSLARPGGVPFACALAGIGFGTIYGLTRYSLVDVGRGLVNWLPSVFFGFFLYQERARYREYRDAFLRALLWGSLLMSVYSLYQFFVLPGWDETWMKGLVYSTFGDPVPLKVRVFSTTNSPVGFAFFLTAALLMILTLLTQRGSLSGRNSNRWGRVLLAVNAPLSLLALALTSVRAMWVALVLGVAYLALTLPGRARVRVGATMLAVLAIGGMATQMPGIHEIVVTRLKTFQTGANDESAAARIAGHRDALARLATEPLGEGMGSTDADHATTGANDDIGPHDSTLLELLYSLGGPGTLIYAIGILWSLARTFIPRGPRTDLELQPFQYAIRASLFAFFAQCLLTSILVGSLGFLIWACFGFAMAAGDVPSIKSAEEILLPDGLPAREAVPS